MNNWLKFCMLLLPLSLAGCVYDPLLGGGYPPSDYGSGGYPYPSNGYPGASSAGQRFRCESIDGRRNYCRANTAGGVALSRQISQTRCLRGSTWGYDGGGVWVSQGCRAEFVAGYGSGGYSDGYAGARTLRCESIDGRMRRCAADTRGGVRLGRQLSDARCDEGRNWGQDRNGVWVNGGCRAEFVLGQGTGGGGYNGDGAYGRTVRCESTDNRRRQCAVGVRRDVRMNRQLSKVPCIEGRNWGWDRNGIWVTNGCRAEFAVD